MERERRRCIFRCGGSTEPCSRASATFAGVVAEYEASAALAAVIHNWAFRRGCELLEHLGVEVPVLRPELGIAQALLERAPIAPLSIWLHAVERTEGARTLRLVPSVARHPRGFGPALSRSASVSRLLSPQLAWTPRGPQTRPSTISPPSY